MATPGTPRRSSIAAIAPVSGSNLTAVAAGASNTFTFVISEPCTLDRLIVSASQPLITGATTAPSGWGDAIGQVEITDFVVNADRLVSGSVSGSLFGMCTPADGPRGTSNPFLGHRVNQSSTVSVTIANRSANSLNIGVSISVL